MSEFRRELLEPSITKRNIIGIILLSAILVSVFAFSVYAVSLIFGTQREDPSNRLKDAPYEDAEELEPHFPIDLDDLMDYLDDLDEDDFNDLIDDLEDLGLDIDNETLEQLLQELADGDINVEEFLEQMMDGDVDNYDLGTAGLAIAALLLSDVEVFRVFDYFYMTSIEERENILWKYECYDNFQGDEWVSTFPIVQKDFPRYDEVPGGSEVLRIKRPLETNIGLNSMVLGSRFNEDMNPSIIDNKNPNSFEAFNLEEWYLYMADLGSTSASLDFNAAINVNMTYHLFGSWLRSNEDINMTSVDELYTPTSIKNKYIQLPGGISNYISNLVHPYFYFHYNKLDAIINDNDNAFMVANKIRNYLQSNFDLSFEDLLNDPPGEEEDIVEWFCQHGEGMYSEFASAFCAFSRAFGVASRFVDGFNSRLIEEIYDNIENLPTYQIKYKNIYNWAEIYVPSDTLGNGKWVQMDVLYDSFGEGGQPINPAKYNITVKVNNTEFREFNRFEKVNLTAFISSSVDPIDNLPITFTDLTTGQYLGSDFTDPFGVASIEYILGTSARVGPHHIEASYQTHENYTNYLLNGDLNVIFTSVSPNSVNISEPNHQSWAVGYVRDAYNGQGLPNAELTFKLIRKSTGEIVNYAFVNDKTYTGSDGSFNTLIEPQTHLQEDQYEIRVDFNSTWLGFPSFSQFNKSSNRLNYNITKEKTYNLYFFVDGRPTEYPAPPNPNTLKLFKRYNSVNLSVIIKDEETGNPASNVFIEFIDHTNGALIGFDLSDSNGRASILYDIGSSNRSGPTLVSASVGQVANYSYYIVNESFEFKNILYSNPLEIDLDGSPSQFNINCNLVDNQNNPISNSRIQLEMNRSGSIYTDQLTITNPIYPNPLGTNNFNIISGIDVGIYTGNYSLALTFNGYFNYMTLPYKFEFYLPYLSNTTYLERQLRVYDSNDIIINFFIESIPTRDLYDEASPPQEYKRGETAYFNVNVYQGGIGISDGYATLWDDFTGDILGNESFSGSNNAQFAVSTDKFDFAGIHRIKVQYKTFLTFNFTYIVINESINIQVNSISSSINNDNKVKRDGESLNIYGRVMENGTGIRGLWIKILLYNETNDNVTHYLIGGNQYVMTNYEGYFYIAIDSISINCPQGSYSIKIDFNGTISWNPGLSLIKNYMISNSSIFYNLNITAGTKLLNSFYWRMGSQKWILGTPLYVYGNLSFDNNIRMSGMKVIATIRAGNGDILASKESSLTDSNGFFNVTFTVGTWLEDTQVWVSFIPVNNLPSPDHYYIEPITQQLIRAT